jgi:mannose-6-phosphate isomerase-like protein (cupin superfamily)
MSDGVIADPVLRQRFRFHTERDAQGELLVVETWVDPGGGVTPHIHPAMDEHFEVVAGEMSFLPGRKWVTVPAGQDIDVPRGTRHAYRNRSKAEAHFIAHVRPPSTLQGFLEDVTRMSQAGLIMRGGIPKGVRGLLQGVVLAHHYRDMAILLFPPMPPPIVQRVLFPPLARLGERRGYRAGNLGAGAGTLTERAA